MRKNPEPLPGVLLEQLFGQIEVPFARWNTTVNVNSLFSSELTANDSDIIIFKLVTLLECLSEMH
jgi:hypothetical protein